MLFTKRICLGSIHTDTQSNALMHFPKSRIQHICKIQSTKASPFPQNPSHLQYPTYKRVCEPASPFTEVIVTRLANPLPTLQASVPEHVATRPQALLP